ncbi:MAG: site-specific integrase, partial [Actinobacteria bacterium]|nr:site-specific integrase [Actinomycetota bacterium]
RATTGAPERTPWLFPGAHPGRPLSPDQLGSRLASYGIDSRAARTNLMLDLASEGLSPSFLADLLGLHPGTAVKWVHAAGGDWTGYVAARGNRTR